MQVKKRLKGVVGHPYFWLVAILSVLALLSLSLIWPPSIRDLLTNFLVDIVGIVITVFFVDWIIRRRENQRWAPAKAYIRGDFAATALELLARATLLLKHAGWQGHTVSQRDTSERKPIAFELEHITPGDIRSALARADEARLADFSSDVAGIRETIANQYDRFSPRLNADETELVLRLDTTLAGVMREFNLIGPDSDLPVIVEDDSQLDDAYEKHMLEASSTLMDAISQSLELIEYAFRLP